MSTAIIVAVILTIFVGGLVNIYKAIEPDGPRAALLNVVALFWKVLLLVSLFILMIRVN